jgi:hypothetical protein
MNPPVRRRHLQPGATDLMYCRALVGSIGCDFNLHDNVQVEINTARIAEEGRFVSRFRVFDSLHVLGHCLQRGQLDNRQVRVLA